MSRHSRAPRTPPRVKRYMRLPRPGGVEERGDRINVPVACNKAMRLLARGGHTREAISSRTGLSAGAVEVVADAMSRHGATAELGWKSLPDSARFSLIKSEYYPVPTRNAWIMARLLAEGATDRGSAVRMPEDDGMRELVGFGRVGAAEGGRFYLSAEGASLAQGVLSMYPEIGWPAFSRFGGAERRARELVGKAARIPPPRLNGRRAGAQAP